MGAARERHAMCESAFRLSHVTEVAQNRARVNYFYGKQFCKMFTRFDGSFARVMLVRREPKLISPNSVLFIHKYQI